MFGEEFFKTRKNLSALISRVIELAHDTGTDASTLIENEVTKGLSNPFLFVVCGEVNAGKSTLLNGLFGRELCEANPLPATDRVQWYRYGELESDKEITPILEERFRPVEFLMDFNLVDTPGTNSVVAGHEKITEKFLPVADLIFWVFPASNPWGASTWDFIQRQDKEILSKSIFILQQADLRNATDIDIILSHMRDIASQRIGRIPSIYPISGKLALHAKLKMPFSMSLWKESGYEKLEKTISETVTQSPARRKVLSRIHNQASGLLTNIEQSIEKRTLRLETNESFVRIIESEMEQMQRLYTTATPDKFVDISHLFISQGRKIFPWLSKQLSLIQTLRSFFWKQNLSKEVEKNLIHAVQDSVESQIALDATSLTQHCRNHWQSLIPRVKEQLTIELDDFDRVSGSMHAPRQNFSNRMGRAAQQAVANLKIRGRLEMHLFQRQKILKKWLIASLLFLCGAGITGSFKLFSYPLLPLGLLCAACLSFFILWIKARSSTKEVIKLFSNHLESNQLTFSRSLERDYSDGVRDFFTAYSALLAEVRHSITIAKMEIQPHLEKWNALFLELKALQKEL